MLHCESEGIGGHQYFKTQSQKWEVTVASQIA